MDCYKLPTGKNGTVQNGVQIVLVNPGNTSQAEATTLIRSHAAKSNHRRIQQGRRAQLAIRHYNPKAPSMKNNIKNQETDSGENSISCQHDRQEVLKPLSQQQQPELYFNPISIINYNRRNPLQTYGRVVLDAEHFLIDHYIVHVVNHNYPRCLTGSEQQLFMQETRSQWVPWALADSNLLAGILMAACHSLYELYPQTTTFHILYLRYKWECIQAIQKALSRQVFASDSTIALAVVLGAEELMSGNIIESRLHSDGAAKMVSIRGGRQYVGGPGLFLNRLLSKYIYNPLLKNTANTTLS